MNIIFAGTPQFSVPTLHALLQSNHRVLAVLTQPDRPKGRGQKLQQSPVKILAQSNNIPVYQPLNLKDPDTLDLLKKLNPDVMIVIAYGLILPKAVLEIPKGGCINVHASLLPRFRGAAPIQAALLSGDKKTGVCTMQMDKGLDTGDILLEKSCEITNTDTSETLQHKLAALGADLMIETLAQLSEKRLSPQKQDETKACYAPKIHKDDAKINWYENAIEIDRKIRAYNPWPIAFTILNDEPLRIWQAEPKPLETFNKDTPPGTILHVDKNGIDVATSEGVLRLLTVQLPGKKPLSIAEILNGHAHLFEQGRRF